MRIAVFSDIHSNYEALECVISDIKKNNYDKVYFLGDVLSKGPNPKECLELVMNNNIDMILGNHELYFLRGVDIDENISEIEKEHQSWIRSNLDDTHRNYLLNCILEINEEFEGVKVSFKHFFQKDSNLDYPFYSIDILSTSEINGIIEKEKSDLIFIGHEHRVFEINYNNKKVFDVGSSGCTADYKTLYFIVNINDGKYNIEMKELLYNRDKFEKIFLESDYPEKELIGEIFFRL